MFHLPAKTSSDLPIVGALWSLFSRRVLHRIATLAILLVTILVSQLIQIKQLNADQASRPNILFIMADDLGCETLGCYGGTSYETPHLDRLAKKGMRFRHCYSMPVCHPSRVCLLTGRYPFRWGDPRWGSFPAAAEKKTMARLLRDGGYATAVAGKWQLTLLKRNPHHPQQLGFDTSCLFGWHEGPRYYDPLIWQDGELREDTAGKFGPDLYCDFLIDFMRKNKDRPFLAYYPMALCHDVTDDLKEPVPFGPAGRYDTYKEMVEKMDARVGRLVQAVKDLGLSERTLILFSGDNGTPTRYIHTAREGKLIRKPVVSMQNGKEVPGGKGSLTNAGTNVPLIAFWPGTIEPGQVVDDLVDFSDFLPTFAELANIAIAEDMPLDGQSFACRFEQDKPAPREWAYAAGRGNKYFVRTADWKLYSDGRLFHVAADEREKQPLRDPEEGSEAAKVRTKLQMVMEQLR